MHSPAHLPCQSSLCQARVGYVFVFRQDKKDRIGRFDQKTTKSNRVLPGFRTWRRRFCRFSGCGVLHGHFHSFHKLFHRKKAEKSGFSRFFPRGCEKKNVESKVFHRQGKHGAKKLRFPTNRPKFGLKPKSYALPPHTLGHPMGKTEGFQWPKRRGLGGRWPWRG